MIARGVELGWGWGWLQRMVGSMVVMGVGLLVQG